MSVKEAGSGTSDKVYIDASGEVKVHDVDWSQSYWMSSGTYPSDLSVCMDPVTKAEGPYPGQSIERHLLPSMDVFSAG